MKIRRIYLGALAVLLSLSSVSCNRGITPGVLRFSHFWSEPAQRAFMDTLLAGFHKEHPEIQVEVSELSWSDGKTKLMVGFNSETAPDVIELGSDWVPQFSASGVLEDVTNNPLLQPRFTNAPKYSWESGMYHGKYFAIPWILDTRIMFVNDSLAALAGAPPGKPVLTDWASMMALGTKISALPGAKGFGVNGSDQHRLYKKFLPYIWSNGGDLLDSTGKPTFNTPQNVEALRYYVAQQDVGLVELQKNVDDAFKRGTIGIWFSGSWILAGLKNAPFKWHTEVFPGNNGHVGESFAGGEYLAINAKSGMRKQAEIFVEYITRPRNELAFAQKVNMYPADVASQRDSFYLNRSQGAVFTEQMSHARMTPVIPQWLDVEAIIEDEVSKALYKKETPEQAMASMQARVVDVMSQP